MAKSNLIYLEVPANPGNYTAGRTKPIRCVTIHHMAGVLSAQACGGIFARAGRGGSAHYGIGNGGEIACYVDEGNTAWTNGNWDSNRESVSIEVSNSELGGDYPVSEAAFNSLVNLVADVAKRNNLGRLVKGENLTWHSMFAQTSCPGPYLLGKMDELAEKVNNINGHGAPEPTPEPTPEPADDTIKVGDKVLPKKYVDENGTRIYKSRDFYFVSEISGERAVLRGDSMEGDVYAAINVDNLRKV